MEKVTIGSLPAYVHNPGVAGLPLIVHLHGIGERGSNLEMVLRYGPLFLIKNSIPIGFDANIIQPQLPAGASWNFEHVMECINYGLNTMLADVTRVHLMGVSAGGGGVYRYLVSDKPKVKLASAVIMSPTAFPMAMVESVLKGTQAIWFAHALNDATCSVLPSVAGAKAVNELAGKSHALLTTAGLFGHSTGGAWGRFMDPTKYYLWDWMKYQKVTIEDEEAKKLQDMLQKIKSVLNSI